MQSLDGLPAEERARRYREVALEISRMADSVRAEDLKVAYRNLSLRWSALAAEVERGLERQEVLATVRTMGAAQVSPL